MTELDRDKQPRDLNSAALLAILLFPPVFVWLLLWPGYRRSLRIAAFTYAFAPSVLMFIALALGSLAGWLLHPPA